MNWRLENTATDFTPAIRRALNRPCVHDFLPSRRRGLNCAGTRLAWKRIGELMEMAAGGAIPNCETLAKHYGVVGKTIMRDLMFLRENFGFVLKFNRRTRCFDVKRAAELKGGGK